MARPKKDALVKPLIQDEFSQNLLAVLEQDGEMPVLTSIGVAKIAGSKSYISYVIKSQGDKVLSVEEVSEPDFQAIAVESAKEAFSNHFLRVYDDVV